MLSDHSIRQKEPGAAEEFYQIVENLDEHVDKILTHLNINPLAISRLGGEACINLKIETQDGNFVLKISPYDGILQVAEYFYRKIREVELASPLIKELDRTKKIIPFEYMLMDFREGVTVAELPEDQHFEAGVIIGNTLKKIHTIIVRDFDEYIASYTQWDYGKWLDRLSYYTNSVPLESRDKIFTPEEVKLVEELIKNPALKISEPNLLHGDVHKSNCLFKMVDGKLTLDALIDPNTTFGDPMFDLALAEALALDTQDFYMGIKEGYGDLSEIELKRINILKTIFMYWRVCWMEFEGQDCSLQSSTFRAYLAEAAQ